MGLQGSGIFPPYSQHFTTPLVALHHSRETLVALHDTFHESTPQTTEKNTVKRKLKRESSRKKFEESETFSGSKFSRATGVRVSWVTGGSNLKNTSFLSVYWVTLQSRRGMDTYLPRSAWGGYIPDPSIVPCISEPKRGGTRRGPNGKQENRDLNID